MLINPLKKLALEIEKEMGIIMKLLSYHNLRNDPKLMMQVDWSLVNSFWYLVNTRNKHFAILVDDELLLTLKVCENICSCLIMLQLLLEIWHFGPVVFKFDELLLQIFLLEPFFLLLLIYFSFCASALLSTPKHLETITLGHYILYIHK